MADDIQITLGDNLKTVNNESDNSEVKCNKKELMESAMNDIINEKNIGKICCAMLTSYEDEQKKLEMIEKIKLVEENTIKYARLRPYNEKDDEKAKEIIKANEKLKKLFGF